MIVNAHTFINLYLEPWKRFIQSIIDRATPGEIVSSIVNELKNTYGIIWEGEYFQVESESILTLFLLKWS